MCPKIRYLPLCLLQIFVIKIFPVKQEPNAEDPLNKEAAEVLRSNKRLFEQNVAKAMRGSYIGGTYFECCLK